MDVITTVARIGIARLTTSFDSDLFVCGLGVGVDERDEELELLILVLFLGLQRFFLMKA